MSLPVVLRPAADADVQTAHDVLNQARPGSGARFVAQLRRVLERIEALPESAGVVWQDVRAVRVKKFRYVVYYVVLADRVEVIAVFHGSQDATGWQSRV